MKTEIVKIDLSESEAQKLKKIMQEKKIRMSSKILRKLLINFIDEVGRNAQYMTGEDSDLYGDTFEPYEIDTIKKH